MRQPKILIVDDTPEVRSLVSRVLEGQGYAVIEAYDGPNACAACQQLKGEIDLLLTDIKMPGMDGIELARNITAVYPAIRVLYISGQCEVEALQPQISRREFGFLSKPFLPQALLDA